MLVGRRYLDAVEHTGRTLRHVLNGLEATVYYPFAQTEGIGEQQQWLDCFVENGEPAMPYERTDTGQRGLGAF